MKRILNYFGVTFSIIIFNSSCAQNVNITFLQVNDVYEMAPVSGGKLGGLARVQTVIDSLKTTNPNTFSVLAGDMLSPSAIGTANYQGEALAGKQMVDILNKMKWDYFVLGNHEFDLKEEQLRKRLQEIKFTVVSDNVLDKNGIPFPNTRPCFKFEVQGVSVGVLGITLNSFKTSYATISDPLVAAKAAVKKLKAEKVDIIIAITHQSIEEDAFMAAEIPEIDMIMGGHEHENYDLLRGDHFTPITKADANAKSAFIHQLTFNKNTKKLTINSELIFIDETIKMDERIEKVVQEWTDIAFASFKEQGYNPTSEICQSDRILDGTEASVRSRSTELTDLITNGFLSAFSKADAALMNGGSIRIDDKLQVGVITEYDILKISPFGGNVSLVTMKGSTLISALNNGTDNVGKGSFLQYANIKGGKNAWTLKGEAIDPNKEYTIAISSYLVEKGDTNLEMLTYANGQVKDTGVASKPFFRIVIDQFEKEFPKK